MTNKIVSLLIVSSFQYTQSVIDIARVLASDFFPRVIYYGTTKYFVDTVASSIIIEWTSFAFMSLFKGKFQ